MHSWKILTTLGQSTVMWRQKKKQNLLQAESLNRMIHYLLFLSLYLCHIIALHSIKCTSEHHQEETEKWDSSLIFIHSNLCDQHGVEKVWQRRHRREPHHHHHQIVNIIVGFLTHFYYFPLLFSYTSEALRSIMPASFSDSQQII